MTIALFAVRRSRAAVLLLHLDGALVDELSAPLDERRAVRLQQLADAARHLLDDAVLPVLHLVRIDRRAGDGDAGVGHVMRLREKVRVRNQRLGRDAAPVDAHAADFFLLDAGDFEAELTGADGARVAAGSTAENDDIVRGAHGWRPFSVAGRCSQERASAEPPFRQATRPRARGAARRGAMGGRRTRRRTRSGRRASAPPRRG